MKLIVTDRYRLAVLLLLGLLLQLPALFYGVDVCDTGYYMTFYDHIFSAPELVSHNFMYYLSGLVGGAVSAATGGSLLALRLAGIAVNLGSVACVWYMGLEAGVPRRIIALSVVCILIGMQIYPQALHNDPLTILLLLVSVRLLQMSRDDFSFSRSFWLIMLSGLVCGINAFTRLPNLLDVLFVLVIVFCFRRQWRALGSFTWLFGWSSGLLVVVLGAFMAGHLDDILSAVEVLVSGASSDFSDTTHNLNTLFTVHMEVWLKAVQLAVHIVAYGVVAVVLWPRFMPWRREKCPASVGRAGGIARWSAWLVRVVPALYLFWRAGCIIYRYDFLMAIEALSIAGCLVTLVFDRCHAGFPLGLLSVVSLLMTLIVPLGSDHGMGNLGPVMFLLALPVGIWGLVRLLPAGFVRGGVEAAVAVILLWSSVSYFVANGFYFDDVRVSEPYAEVSSPSLRFIRTTPGRAARLDSLVTRLKAHVSPGTRLLIVGNAPMLYHLTGAEPVMGCSWPELMPSHEWNKRLLRAPMYDAISSPYGDDDGGNLPLILMLRFNPLGRTWGAASDAFIHPGPADRGAFHNADKYDEVYLFMRCKDYELLTETADFVLYRPKPRVKKSDTDRYPIDDWWDDSEFERRMYEYR